MMDYDLPQPIPQGSDGTQAAEDSRILEVADELRRRCKLHEAKLRDGENHVNTRQIEESVAEQYAKETKSWIPFPDVFELGTYEVWDLFPRNVLVDSEGDLYVVDAEIRKL